MYSLLIVEDELFIRNFLLDMVDWPRANVSPVGAVSNGMEALAFLRETPADLVITDIRMPKMDGLELACELQAHYPNVRTVLYSAYNEFEFARRGIQYGVYGYLLKSQDEDEIVECFAGLTAKMDRERSLSLRQGRDSGAVLWERRRRLARALWEGSLPPAQAAQEAEACGIRLNGRYAAVLFAIYSPSSSLADLSLLRRLGNRVADKLLEGMVWQNGGDLLTVDGLPPAREQAACHILGIWRDTAGLPASLEECRRDMGEQVASLASHQSFGISVAMGPAGSGPAEIAESIRGAFRALSRRYYLGWDRVLTCRESNAGPGEDPGDAASPQTLEADLAWLAQRLRRDEPPREKAVEAYRRFLERWGVEDVDDSIQALAKCGTMDEAMGLLSRILGNGGPVDDSRQQRRLVEKVTEYLHANFFHEITLKQAADHVNIHPVYLSRLYKQETGVTFKAKLTSLRIDYAKTLLDNIDLKVYEISEKVGYNKPRYFSELFKEYTGMTPLEYRERPR